VVLDLAPVAYEVDLSYVQTLLVVLLVEAEAVAEFRADAEASMKWMKWCWVSVNAKI
jgi:tRNA threonylcarbamoyladenosine modification (KEOPS) complex  Pcc1 subunit